MVVIKSFKLFLSLSIISLAILFIAPSVLAYSPADAVRDTLQLLDDIFSPLFSILFGDYETNDFLYMKLLVSILVYIMISYSLSKVPAFSATANGDPNKGVRVIISLVVCILAVRYMSQNDLLTNILLPYGVLGVVLVTVLPFLIFFFFINSINGTGVARRLLWAVFGIVFGVLWFNRNPSLDNVQNQIYLGVLVLIGLSFIFDRAIHRYFALYEHRLFLAKATNKTIAHLQSEYLTLLNVNTGEAKTRLKEIGDEITRLGGSLP